MHVTALSVWHIPVSFCFFFFSSRRRHTRSDRDWSSDVCSSDLSAMKWLTGLGAIYLTAALARIVIGISIETAPAWFRAWISGVFHVVLASFLLEIGRASCRERV